MAKILSNALKLVFFGGAFQQKKCVFIMLSSTLNLSLIFATWLFRKKRLVTFGLNRNL